MATAAAKRPKKASKTKGSINKAEEIRKAAKEMGGKKVRPKDLIAALAAKGITVAPAQVSATLKAAGMRRTRRKKAAASPQAHHQSAPAGPTLEHLLAAKALAGKLGGIDKAKKALDAWAKLM